MRCSLQEAMVAAVVETSSASSGVEKLPRRPPLIFSATTADVTMRLEFTAGTSLECI